MPPPPAWVESIPLIGGRITESWQNYIENAESTLKEWKPWLKEGGRWLLGHSVDLAKGFLHLVLSVLIAFFFYRDGEGLVAQSARGHAAHQRRLGATPGGCRQDDRAERGLRRDRHRVGAGDRSRASGLPSPERRPPCCWPCSPSSSASCLSARPLSGSVRRSGFSRWARPAGGSSWSSTGSW